MSDKNKEQFMIVKIFNIKLDVDYDIDGVFLPTEVKQKFKYTDNQDELEEYITDWLSDEYPLLFPKYCVRMSPTR